MEKGEKILVRSYPDKILERIFLEDHGTYALVCRQEVYEEARKSGSEPKALMGFPIEDIMALNLNLAPDST